jgi:hypothetical protein
MERDLQQKCIHLARKAGVWAIKFHAEGRRGFPDLLLIFPDGVVVFVELKTVRGVLSKLQQRTIDKLKARECNVHVCRTLKRFAELLKLYA